MRADGCRVVVTGMGAVTPVGLRWPESWKALLAGISGVGPITRFDASDFKVRIGAEVKGFDGRALFGKLINRMDRFSQFSCAAALEALEAAGLDLAGEDLNRVGVEIGTAVGGLGLLAQQAQILAAQGPRKVNPIFAPLVLANMSACNLSIYLGCKGPASCPVAACATGTVAVGEAARRLERGDADVMIAGGTEAAITALGVAAFSNLGALSRRNDEPKRACRPFDAERDGTLLGEGSAVLVLERLDHAQRRDARILAEVAGYGFTSDAYHVVAAHPDGEGAARAMASALVDAGLVPEDVAYICAHGTGTVLNDPSETKAIHTAFGQAASKLAVSSVKSMVGHMIGASGALSVMVGVQAIQERRVPPTINLENPDPECDLDYVPNVARDLAVDVALANAFGFGGQNASVVLKRFEE